MHSTINAVADDILDVTEAGDTGLRDALNLMVNAIGVYLAEGWSQHDPCQARQRLSAVADQSDAEADLDTVIGWIQEGSR